MRPAELVACMAQLSVSGLGHYGPGQVAAETAGMLPRPLSMLSRAAGFRVCLRSFDHVQLQPQACICLVCFCYLGTAGMLHPGVHLRTMAGFFVCMPPQASLPPSYAAAAAGCLNKCCLLQMSRRSAQAAKMGRKARLKAKRAAKQQERKAGSDDDDMPTGDGFEVQPEPCSSYQPRELLRAAVSCAGGSVWDPRLQEQAAVRCCHHAPDHPCCALVIPCTTTATAKHSSAPGRL